MNTSISTDKMSSGNNVLVALSNPLSGTLSTSSSSRCNVTDNRNIKQMPFLICTSGSEEFIFNKTYEVISDTKKGITVRNEDDVIALIGDTNGKGLSYFGRKRYAYFNHAISIVSLDGLKVISKGDMMRHLPLYDRENRLITNISMSNIQISLNDVTFSLGASVQHYQDSKEFKVIQLIKEVDIANTLVWCSSYNSELTNLMLELYELN